LNEVHRKISIGSAPRQSGAGCATFIYSVARIPQKWTPVLRKNTRNSSS
jgi:hypothetical protein